MNKILVIFLVLSLSVNAYLFFLNQNGKSGVPQLSASPLSEIKKYPFLAKRIFTEAPNDVIINFVSLREKLRDFAKPFGSKLGIYFEYLPTGNHVGINDRNAFRRASLVKIPVVMRVYKLIEEGKLTKNQEVEITDNQVDTGSGKIWKKGAGAKLTVEEAIGATLVDSDNTAFNLLRDLVNQTLDKESGSENETLYVYDYLDIPRDENEDKTLNISSRGFASILKSLYFSAYLNYIHSNEMLSIMATPTKSFNMISAPIPDNIRVAHKYGINREGPDTAFVTSDCGILFYPERPYVLCVMMNEPPEVAADTLVAISRMVYDFIKSVNTN